MKTIIFLVMLLISSICSAVEYDPLPPVSTIPATATRSTNCVGVDQYGVIYCNTVYTWKKRINRFCCTYQRDLAFAVVLGEIVWLKPLPNKTDTRITAVSNDGRIGGVSMGPKASLPVATIWTDYQPQQVAGYQVDAISNYAYASGGEVKTHDGISIKPAVCGQIYSLNDLGDGLCWATIGDHQGLVRFSDENLEDVFLTQFKPSNATINNTGVIVGTYTYATLPPQSFRIDADGDWVTSGTLMDVNDQGDAVGSDGLSGTINGFAVPGTTVINAINENGEYACQNIVNGRRVGCSR